MENVGMREGETKNRTMYFSRARQKSDEAKEMRCKEGVLRHKRKWNNTLCTHFFYHIGEINAEQYAQDSTHKT